MISNQQTDTTMAKTTATTASAPGAPTTEAPTPEPRNVLVEVLENRTHINGAIVAAGLCDFPLTASEAKALEALGKVRIVGLAKS